MWYHVLCKLLAAVTKPACLKLLYYYIYIIYIIKVGNSLSLIMSSLFKFV